MAAVSLLARSLLALACFALLAAAASHRRNLPNCDEYLQGQSSVNAIVLPKLSTSPYEKRYNLHNEDHCMLNERRLVGALIKVCDPFGPPPPSINAINIQDQVITCHSDGPCPSGLDIWVSQYCEP